MKSTLSIFGLVLLLLLSPCKVRNFIQAELGVPQTKVLNKSKSAISDCQTFELSEIVQQTSKPTCPQSNFPYLDVYSYEFIINSLKNSYTQITAKNVHFSRVSLHILYQNIQVYS